MLEQVGRNVQGDFFRISNFDLLQLQATSMYNTYEIPQNFLMVKNLVKRVAALLRSDSSIQGTLINVLPN